VGDRHQAKLLQPLLAPAGAEPLYFVDIAVPLHLSDRPGTAVLAAHVYWRWAAEVVQGIVPRYTARDLIDVFLVDAQGQIIYPDPATGQAQVPPGVAPGSRQTVVEWGDGQRYLTQTVAVPEAWPATPLGWRVVVRQPLDAALAELRDLQRVTIWGTLAASAVFLLLAWWGARYISRPLEALARQARRIAAGDETAVLGVQGGGADILRLSDAVAAMAQTLIARKNALKQNNLQLEHKVAERTAELALANQALRQLARLDALTGLPNRLAVEERLVQEFTRFRRAGQPYSVVVLDIDHFKQVNDTWGHATGDQVLRHVAAVLRASLRASDFIGRTGGEEFLLLLPETPLPAALEVADKVRAALHAQPEATAGVLSLSAGVSEAQLAHQDADVAVREADQALYRAKRGGRNRVEASSRAGPANGDQPR
jgi:diguanylate cyclase